MPHTVYRLDISVKVEKADVPDDADRPRYDHEWRTAGSGSVSIDLSGQSRIYVADRIEAASMGFLDAIGYEWPAPDIDRTVLLTPATPDEVMDVVDSTPVPDIAGMARDWARGAPVPRPGDDDLVEATPTPARDEVEF